MLHPLHPWTLRRELLSGVSKEQRIVRISKRLGVRLSPHPVRDCAILPAALYISTARSLMSEIRFTHRLRYAFDNSMSKGAIALIGYLALASLALIMVAALAVIFFGVIPGGEDKAPGFGEAMWLSLM